MPERPPKPPFLLRFADPLPEDPGVPLHYDPERQQAAAVTPDGVLDARAARADDPPKTMHTFVRIETTDDN